MQPAAHRAKHRKCLRLVISWRVAAARRGGIRKWRRKRLALRIGCGRRPQSRNVGILETLTVINILRVNIPSIGVGG